MLTKFYGLKVSKELYKWLKEHKPKFIRSILEGYKNGVLTKHSDGENKIKNSVKGSTRFPDMSGGDESTIFSNVPLKLECIYHAIDPKDPKKYCWCDTKRIPLTVCEARQEQFRQDQCEPVTLKKRKSTRSNNAYIRFGRRKTNKPVYYKCPKTSKDEFGLASKRLCDNCERHIKETCPVYPLL